jgi:hypothetical protein
MYIIQYISNEKNNVYYCCLRKTCQNTNKHKIGASLPGENCESHISRTNSSIVLISFAIDLHIFAAGPGTFSSHNIFIFTFLQNWHQKSISYSLCSRFLKNHCLDLLKIFTVYFSDLEAGPSIFIIVIFDLVCISL